MEALNKRKMMLAISVSLAAYAFAISGCGKKSDDSDTAAVARSFRALGFQPVTRQKPFIL
jgi:hypothetical protein